MKEEYLQSYDFNKIRNLPGKYKIEKTLAEGLKSRDNNFQNAIMSLPKNSRELYPHAYQVKFLNLRVIYGIQQFQKE